MEIRIKSEGPDFRATNFLRNLMAFEPANTRDLQKIAAARLGHLALRYKFPRSGQAPRIIDSKLKCFYKHF